MVSIKYLSRDRVTQYGIVYRMNEGFNKVPLYLYNVSLYGSILTDYKTIFLIYTLAILYRYCVALLSRGFQLSTKNQMQLYEGVFVKP